MAAVNVNEVFDVEAAISEFLADPTRTSLELPRMTTGQRKHAKKVADSYPQLTCESFGFGQERQLHLFKKVTDVCLTSATVNVKNTFIDDFINGEVQDSVMFRSMPPQLTKKYTPGSIMQSSAKLGSFQADRSHAAASTDCSTSASGSSAYMGSPSSSPRGRDVSPPPGLRDFLTFTPPPGLEVRNTFIHFPNASRDERSVQSMPHGMFGKCLFEESLSAKAASPASTVVTVEADSPARVPGTMVQGTEVMIQGLTKLPAFNGLCGAVQSFDDESGRYTILLNTPAGDGRHKTAKVKGENLWVIAVSPPPPPRHTPSLMLDEVHFQGAGLLGFPTTPMWEDRVHTAHTLRLTALV